METTTFTTTDLVDSDNLKYSTNEEHTIDDYIQYIIPRIGEETGAIIICVADRLVNMIFNIENPKERDQAYKKCRGYLIFVSLTVQGKLYSRIRQLEYQLCDVEPMQAPKGWKCAICMTSKDSHLCERTLCGHYFHIGCSLK